MQIDCLVVGAGPAGLTAATYLARYRRRVVVAHDGDSRAWRMPLAHNVPGFPGGVTGPDLIARLTEQAQRYGAQLRHARVSRISRAGALFEAAELGIAARSVILATGVRLLEVELDHQVHEAAMAAGRLRYCPICDGFEATDKRIAVLGADRHGAREALFLRGFSNDVTLLTRSSMELDAAERRELTAAGVDVVAEPVAALEPDAQRMRVVLKSGAVLDFDILYPALGCAPRSDLAGQLTAELTDAGCVPTDARQRTNVPGLFAAGDVVEALDQVSVAAGHGAIAATTAHNYLRATAEG